MIPERLSRLRREMKERGIDIYVVPTADFHESEYVGAHFKARSYIIGFTGSAGTAVITAAEAGLWTDARYFLQAKSQLENTGVTLYRMGEEGVPTIMEYLRSALPEGGTLGFDGRVINARLGAAFLALAKEKNGKLAVGEDLVGNVWDDRPALPQTPVRILAPEYSGRSTAEKIADVRAEMKKQGAGVHLLTSLYDIAWLLNVRGGDIDYVPVVLSYLALTEETCLWFVQDAILTDGLRTYLAENRIETRPYESFYAYAAAIPAGETVLLDKGVCNYRLVSEIAEDVSIADEPNPTVRMKAVKNDTEQKNTVNAHIRDGIAVTKFVYWLKKNIGREPMTELSAADYLAARRAEQEGFLDMSFETICAYGAHAAIIHYAPTSETDIPLEPHGLLLVDSGGHYLEGTTDITRTIALGSVTEAERADYTRVLRSHLHLANARFLYGCTGLNLDILAREPLWEAGLDYKHGTGHGIGHILNVHEGPNGFRWRQSPERSEGSVLEEGMITTDEPGLYVEGAYGIRIESELLCRRGAKNEFGQFMYFQNLTCAPIDLDAIDTDALTKTERRWLNEYHTFVYDTLAPHLAEEERAWLRGATRAI